MADYEDPGWRAPLRGAVWIFIPFVGWTFARRSRSGGVGLLSLRRIYLVLVGSLLLFIIAFSFVTPWDGGDEGWTPIAVFALGVFQLVAVIRVNGRPLSTQTPEQLAATYRSRFFIGIGMAEAAALWGVCGMFIEGSLWIYLVGLAFALAGFAIIAPSRANIERKQHQIRAQGSPLSLGQALTDFVPPG